MGRFIEAPPGERPGRSNWASMALSDYHGKSYTYKPATFCPKPATFFPKPATFYHWQVTEPWIYTISVTKRFSLKHKSAQYLT